MYCAEMCEGLSLVWQCRLSWWYSASRAVLVLVRRLDSVKRTLVIHLDSLTHACTYMTTLRVIRSLMRGGRAWLGRPTRNRLKMMGQCHAGLSYFIVIWLSCFALPSKADMDIDIDIAIAIDINIHIDIYIYRCRYTYTC